MGLHAKTKELIETAAEILAASEPMTIRQLYYALVVRQIIENSQRSYHRLVDALVTARKGGMIPWENIEDRLRRPRSPPMWDDAEHFLESVIPQYRRNVWADQARLTEIWIEKDALSAVFEKVLHPYGITLCVCRGYNSWSAAHEAAERFDAWGGEVSIIYFGDFDPSGEDMVRAIAAQMEHFCCRPEIAKAAILKEDIARYSLPPDPAKVTDRRAAGFVAKNGNECVELDALPVDVLRQRIVDEVEARLDLDALKATRALEAADAEHLAELAAGFEEE